MLVSVNKSSPPIAVQPELESDELEDDLDSDNEDSNTFSIRDELTQYTARMMKTKELHSLIHEGAIDLNPDYQRDVVWPENKQIGLIDSIFRNFYIPPIVFSVHKDIEGEEVRICVDGKQRLTSIQRFFDGQIPHRDTRTRKNFWYTTSESARGVRHEVPPHWKSVFSEKQIPCVEYVNIAPATEREIFQRVQLGMTLTAAEKLQAISSPWAEWVTELERKHVAVDQGLADVLQWDTKRGRNFQNIAYLVFCCDGLPDEELLPTAQKIEKWLLREDNPPEQFKANIEQVLQDYWVMATKPDLNMAFKKIQARLAPVEFIFVGVLLFVLRGEPPRVRANAIFNLRTHIRQNFKDVRNNGNVGKVMWQFINQVKQNPGPDEEKRDAKSKRKRKFGADPEDDEYRPQPVKGLGKAVKTRSKQPRQDNR